MTNHSRSIMAFKTGSWSTSLSSSTSTTPLAGYSKSCVHRWMVVVVTVWWMCVGVVGAQDCGDTNVEVVVVASVFGTLAVVALVLGLVLFLVRRRNGGVLFPKRGQATPSAASAEEGHATSDSCYVNAAFSAHDVTDAEPGRKKSSPQKSQSPNKKLLKTDSQKTWVSLPGGRDHYPEELHRHGSCGSLGANCMSAETESVWLLSQDIIGLGFNISGNMRDGIYVSQVHSRGPAVESGKIQVGDRILSVTIGYENMVYEDALTILSYASPYPVKLTVQKERAAHVNPQHPASSEQLNHPVYRSQSLDALKDIGKDPSFRPKRTLSEIKSDPRLKAERSHTAMAISQSYPQYESAAAGRDRFPIGSYVQVHQAAGLDTPVSAVVTRPLRSQAGQVSTGDGDGDLEMEASADLDKEDTDTLATRKKSRLDMDAAREFANLMDQVQDAPGRKLGEESAKCDAARTAPSKPERKKKPSNSSTVSSDESAEALADVGVDEAFQAKSSAEVQSLPKSADQQEIQEAQIHRSFVKRDIAMGSENIELLPVDNLERATSPERGISVSLSEHKRIVSAQRDEVEEELFAAPVASREVSAGPPSTSSTDRETSRNRESRDKEKKKKKEEKKPVLSEEELERLIAMNSFPPGSQGWAGIQAGGKQGGIHDEFLPRDLPQAFSAQIKAASARRSSSSSEASSQSFHRQKGGVAFEVRDDVLTGRPLSVDISRSRNSSASPSRSGSRDRMPRASSLHDNHHHPKRHLLENKENREDRLDWSGKRLVRAGSFSQIPQDDSPLNDWTDKRTDDDDISTESGKPSTADTNPDSDSEMDPPPRTLISRDVFKARENLANMSDLSNSMSSSRSSSPLATNGPMDAVTPSSSSSSVPGLKHHSTDLQSSSDSNGNSKMVSVQLHTGTEEEMEC